MKHLYEAPDGIIHLCEGGKIAVNDDKTYVVWTKCGSYVPANKSFKSMEDVTCDKCLCESVED